MTYTNIVHAMLRQDVRMNDDMVALRSRQLAEIRGKITVLQDKMKQLKSEEKYLIPNWYSARDELVEEKEKRETTYSLCKEAIVIGAALDDLRTEIPDIIAAVDAWAAAMPPGSSKGAEGVATSLRETLKKLKLERADLETRFHAFHDLIAERHKSQVETEEMKAAANIATEVAAELRVWADEIANAEDVIAYWEQQTRKRGGMFKGKGKAKAALLRLTNPS